MQKVKNMPRQQQKAVFAKLQDPSRGSGKKLTKAEEKRLEFKEEQEQSKPFKKMPKSAFHLPLETAVYVPSTKYDKKVSKREYQKRVNETRKQLSEMLGGYTSVEAVGGYVSKDGTVIKEPITKVTAFSTRKAYSNNQGKYLRFLESKKKAWKQESIGYEFEGDLYYF